MRAYLRLTQIRPCPCGVCQKLVPDVSGARDKWRCEWRDVLIGTREIVETTLRYDLLERPAGALELDLPDLYAKVADEMLAVASERARERREKQELEGLADVALASLKKG